MSELSGGADFFTMRPETATAATSSTTALTTGANLFFAMLEILRIIVLVYNWGGRGGIVLSLSKQGTVFG